MFDYCVLFFVCLGWLVGFAFLVLDLLDYYTCLVLIDCRFWFVVDCVMLVICCLVFLFWCVILWVWFGLVFRCCTCWVACVWLAVCDVLDLFDWFWWGCELWLVVCVFVVVCFSYAVFLFVQLFRGLVLVGFVCDGWVVCGWGWLLGLVCFVLCLLYSWWCFDSLHFFLV